MTDGRYTLQVLHAFRILLLHLTYGARRAWPVRGDVTARVRHIKRPTQQLGQLRVGDKVKERAN